MFLKKQEVHLNLWGLYLWQPTLIEVSSDFLLAKIIHWDSESFHVRLLLSWCVKS